MTSERKARWIWWIAVAATLLLVSAAYAQAHQPAAEQPTALTLILAFGGSALASGVGVLVGMGRYDERLKAQGREIGELKGKVESADIGGMKEKLATHDREIDGLRDTKHEHANYLSRLLAKLGMLMDPKDG